MMKDSGPFSEAKRAEIHRQAMCVFATVTDGLALLAARRSVALKEFLSEAKKAIMDIEKAIAENPLASHAVINPVTRAEDALQRLAKAITL